MRTNSLGTKLSQGFDTWETQHQDRLPWDEALLELRHLGDTTLRQTALGRSSLSSSTLGRHSNRTNSLGMKPSLNLYTLGRQQYNQFPQDETLFKPLHTWETTVQPFGSALGREHWDKFPWDEALIEHRHLGDTITGLTPLGRSSFRASTLGRHNNRTNSLGTKFSQSIDTRETQHQD